VFTLFTMVGRNHPASESRRKIDSFSTMNSSLKIGSRNNPLTINRTSVTVTADQEIQKIATRTKAVSRIQLFIRPSAEFIAGLLAALYLLGALALGGAVLCFTFCHG
jgi:hypothetical protein